MKTMLRFLFIVLGLCTLVNYSMAQWSRTAPNVYLTTSTDKVGIGTSSPSNKLHLFSSTGDVTQLLECTYTYPTTYLKLKIGSTIGKIGMMNVPGPDAQHMMVGTESNYALKVITNNLTRMHITADGKIGVNGLITPTAILDIQCSSSLNELQFTGSQGVQIYAALSDIYTLAGTSKMLHFGSNNTNSQMVLKNGCVGIGTTDPNSNYKLSVVGKIRANEVVVETGWSDFVFEKNYRLPSLREVEKYIAENKHLEGIPSSAEVKKNGISLGTMQANLLQKIEELTLYAIELKKQNEDLRSRVERLENSRY